MAISAGILLYREVGPRFEVLIAHPGGPLWATRDDGAWSIPKGEIDAAEDVTAAAVREFEEETGHRLRDTVLQPLGTVRQRSGKVVHGFAVRADMNPDDLASNRVEIIWPPRSATRITIPEIDRLAWVDPETARRKLNPAQGAFVDRLVVLLQVET